MLDGIPQRWWSDSDGNGTWAAQSRISSLVGDLQGAPPKRQSEETTIALVPG
jgi:hypothetical protein